MKDEVAQLPFCSILYFMLCRRRTTRRAYAPYIEMSLWGIACDEHIFVFAIYRYSVVPVLLFKLWPKKCLPFIFVRLYC